MWKLAHWSLKGISEIFNLQKNQSCYSAVFYHFMWNFSFTKQTCIDVDQVTHRHKPNQKLVSVTHRHKPNQQLVSHTENISDKHPKFDRTCLHHFTYICLYFIPYHSRNGLMWSRLRSYANTTSLP